MWIKVAVLGVSGPGFIFSGLVAWTMAGLGITIAFHSSRKWDNCNKRLGVVAQEENDNRIDQLPEENDNRIDHLPEENDNRIDQLPDDILCNIVSRLRPAEASRTSILSRSWRNIWTLNHKMISSCLYSLDIFKMHHDHVPDRKKQIFLKAVDQRLQLYSGRKLKVFFMHCCFLKDHMHHLVQWLQALARLDVEELYLGNSCKTFNGDPLDKAFTFSFELIKRLSKLKHLNLMACYVKPKLSSQCNSLESINLSYLRLRSHNVSNILLSCPNLESLGIIQCALPLNLRISGPNLKLEELVILICYNVQKLEVSNINVMTLEIDIRNEVEVLLSSVPKLVKLHLRTPKMNYRFGDVRREAPQLKSLLLQTSYQMMRLPPAFQVFRSIKKLYLMTRGYPNPKSCKKVDLWNFTPVLSACPLLERFFLQLGGRACKRERKADEWPVLRHENLWLMELSGFSYTQNELEFAKFILTSCQVLEALVLRLSRRRYDFDEFYFEDVKDTNKVGPGVAEAVCANLQEHALSTDAQVEMLF